MLLLLMKHGEDEERKSLLILKGVDEIERGYLGRGIFFFGNEDFFICFLSVFFICFYLFDDVQRRSRPGTIFKSTSQKRDRERMDVNGMSNHVVS